jgi:hypothetical protein
VPTGSDGSIERSIVCTAGGIRWSRQKVREMPFELCNQGLVVSTESLARLNIENGCGSGRRSSESTGVGLFFLLEERFSGELLDPPQGWENEAPNTGNG